MRIITIKIARLIAALFIIGGFSSTVPIAAAAPKEQTEITESVPPTAPVHEAPVKLVCDIPSQGSTMGHAHTCVIDDHNDVWCWGSNGFGELGRGYASDEVFPQKQAIQGLKATSIFAKSNGKTCATDTGRSGAYLEQINTLQTRQTKLALPYRSMPVYPKIKSSNVL